MAVAVTYSEHPLLMVRLESYMCSRAEYRKKNLAISNISIQTRQSFITAGISLSLLSVIRRIKYPINGAAMTTSSENKAVCIETSAGGNGTPLSIALFHFLSYIGDAICD